MQLMIDTANETPINLLRVAAFLSDIAKDIPVPAGTTAANIPPPPPLTSVVIEAAAPAQLPAANIPPPPPPPPPAAAAVAPANSAAAAAPVVSSELDADGLPWDARIHANTKARNANNTWRTKRGLPAGMLETITAELRVMYPARTAGAVPPPPPAAVRAPDAGAVPPPPSVNAGGVPPPPPPPAATATVLPSDGAQQGLTFPKLMEKITGAMNTGKLNKAQLDQVLTACGVGTIAVLAASADKFSTVETYLAQHYNVI